MSPVPVSFVGNCQAEALANFYREFCASDDETDVAYVDTAQLGDDDPARLRHIERLRRTRVLVQQVFDWSRKLDEHVPAGCARFGFPNATLWCLWPHTGVAHPRNREAPDFAGVEPPYPAEYGNAFLNRCIDAGMKPADAVKRYLELDIVRRTSLDSRFEKEMDLLDRRDGKTRIGLRDAIETGFRREPLFRTRGHPNKRIFSLVARALFGGMGIDPSRIENGLRSLREAPFPPGELPIHPKIAAHLGLEYAGPDTLYQYSLEGRFTFAEYAERYMNFTYNGALRRLRASRGLPPEQRLAITDAALAVSPGSVFVHRHRSKLLALLGRREAALEAAREACTVAPCDPETWFELGAMLRQFGDAARAALAARDALALYPYHAAALTLLGRLELESGRPDQAAAHLRAAKLYAPRDEAARRLYAVALQPLGAVGR